MNLLWINNIVIPQISKSLDLKTVCFGGWMVKLADQVSEFENINLTIACPHKQNRDGISGKVRFFTFNFKDKKASTERAKEIIKATNPDIIHIFGTEYEHSYIFTEAAKILGIREKVVISIQGLVSVYSRHYKAFLPHYVVKRYTLRDVYKGNVETGMNIFIQRGQSEIAALRNVDHIIGRTDWDKACTQQINPDAQYHFNNETLRDSFYTSEKWDYNVCEKHSVFMSQGSYPIKGLHLAIQAIEIVKNTYPDVKLYIAGNNLLKKQKYKLSYYERYIIKLINDCSLKSSVVFTGMLDEKQMVERFLKSNVFVSASSIENSPNSLGEAMILGVPVVSSMVGGVTNMMKHGEEGYYYQADAPYMLAYYICELFGNPKKATEFGNKAREHALITHDAKKNLNDLLGIYYEIIGK